MAFRHRTTLSRTRSAIAGVILSSSVPVIARAQDALAACPAPRPSTVAPSAEHAGHEGMTMPDTPGDASRRMADLMIGPLGISHTRMGSGTSWLPDSAPMHAGHALLRGWLAMTHGAAFLEYDAQGSRRGDDQAGLVNWGMLMLMRRVGCGTLHLHGMASLEPLTIGGRGYPLLLQTGETYRGRPLVDRQHPHDLFMELAALYERPVSRRVAVSLYAGAVGEPALGPVAFMHRPSAQSDPFSPLGHHWQDATHVSFGVLTAGVYTRAWKLEGSIFNGREPDENRWDFDFAPLHSASARLTVNPTARWSLAGWYGVLADAEVAHDEDEGHGDVRRYGLSALHSGRGLRGGHWATLAMWGANAEEGAAENSFAAESNLEIGDRHTVFGRAELVRKRAGELAIESIDPERGFDIGSFVLGYVRELARVPGGSLGAGLRASVNVVPRALEDAYGTRTPSGIAVYLRLRPGAMRHAMDDAMAHDGQSMSAR
jgi:hypothetical protein